MDVSTTRTLYWEGSSRQDLKTFPLPVQKDLGVALYVLQIGGKPQSIKHWKGLGSGVLELRETWMGDAFRVVVMLPGQESVRVLHAFQKKSRSGISTPRQDRELIENRWREVLSRGASGGRMTITQDETPVGTTNALHDLGFADAEELSVKAQLAVKLNAIIDKRLLNQNDVARITGMKQPKVSLIRRYKLQNISLERLMQALVALDQRVEIRVRSAGQRKPSGITVAA